MLLFLLFGLFLLRADEPPWPCNAGITPVVAKIRKLTYPLGAPPSLAASGRAGRQGWRRSQA